MDLLDKYPEAGNYLIKEPVKFNNNCNDILFACLMSFESDFLQYVKPSQININLRVKCVPRFLLNPKLRCYDGITVVQGKLLDVSSVTNYVYHTVWSCPEECEDNEVILHNIPKVPPKCYSCKSTLFENSGLRKCGDKVVATFKLDTEILPRKFVMVDDLIMKLKFGYEYLLYITVLKKRTIVWSIQEVVPLPAPLTTPIPDDIKELFDKCKGVPWKFVYCLASTIGGRICPLNNFMTAKIGLLLSLASVKANVYCGSPILHFLATGNNLGYIGRLMCEAALLAASSAYIGTNSSISTCLINASGGICFMPLPLQAYHQKQIHSILSVIETGDIPPNKAKLRCAVWAYGSDFKKIILYNFGSVFGTVYRGDCGEYADELADFTLERAINPSAVTNEEKQALNDIRKYIDIVANVRVTLNEEAETLLSSYFLAARKERPKAVTVGNFEALVSTCITSARLCRREVANIHDAVFAIWLHVSGMTEPRFAPDEYLNTPADIAKLKNIMKKFTEWLENFTGCSSH
ncbi:MEI-218 protein [Danaus plexippus plexippus]|uniref:MEI-218 protein n=1 Tax=Danaus plexippus plexippus TaxID=278856 RepID=A0A212FC54_DANPL|nr:MEI-218 protein [Danaus plexippus plexippus]